MLVGMTRLKPKRTNDQSVQKEDLKSYQVQLDSYRPCCVAVVASMALVILIKHTSRNPLFVIADVGCWWPFVHRRHS